MKNKIKIIINIISVVMLIISLASLLKKCIYYTENAIKYEVCKSNRDSFDDWIIIDGTRVDYPIMHGDDNAYYLTHSYDDTENPSGSIFYDYRDEPYDNLNTTIYGHSMKDGSMFNNLHILKNEDEFKNSVVKIYSDGKWTEYYPISMYVTSDDYFFNNLNKVSHRSAYKKVLEKSSVVTDVLPTDKSKMITLLTCDYSMKGAKLILHYISR